MQNTSKSLWPEKIGVTAVPEPVKFLREQCAALEGLTDGKLYGEVLQSSLPSVKAATYDFYIGVSGKV